jgi:3-oxoacyl-[acyl-carrier-protein] synthase-1
MRRVVVTGLGIVSSLGNTQADVVNALRHGRSGIAFNPEYRDVGLRCQVSGRVVADIDRIDRKHRRFMGEASAYAYLAMQDAVADASLTPELVSNPRTGCVMGVGGGSSADIVEANDILRAQGVRKVGPYRVPRTMTSSVAACISSFFGIQGLNYAISSACATSAHCIGHGVEQIQFGKQDIVFAGGAEAIHISQTCMFDAMGALTTAYNDRPEQASRPYDRDRDGFAISGGAGVLVLESRDHALQRGAQIYAEVLGYGTAGDGADMVAPNGEGALRAMRAALETCPIPVDYLNTHGTSTPVGDLIEIAAIQRAFGDAVPAFSSTKSLSGHALGAAGVHEAIYCLLMMRHHFMAASHNIDNPDPDLAALPLLTSTASDVAVNCAMSNSFGFGGANASLIFGAHSG